MINPRQIITSLNNVPGFRHDCDAAALPALGTSAIIAGTSHLTSLQSGAAAGGTVLSVNSASIIGKYRYGLGTSPTQNGRAGLITSWMTNPAIADSLWSFLPATAIGFYFGTKLSPQALSTAAQEFALVVGFVSDISAAAANSGGVQVAPSGCYIKYDRQLGTDWRPINKNGASVSDPGSGVAVNPGAPDVLLQGFKPPGSDVVTYEINGARFVVPLNAPTGTQLGFCCSAFRSNGVAAVTAFDVDFVEYAAYVDLGRV